MVWFVIRLFIKILYFVVLNICFDIFRLLLCFVDGLLLIGVDCVGFVYVEYYWFCVCVILSEFGYLKVFFWVDFEWVFDLLFGLIFICIMIWMFVMCGFLVLCCEWFDDVVLLYMSYSGMECFCYYCVMW